MIPTDKVCLKREPWAMDEMEDVTIGSALLSELLLARLRDPQLRSQDDLEAFRIECDLFKTLQKGFLASRNT